MAATYEPIASTTLGSDAQVEFTSIPDTHTDLVVVAHVKAPSGGPYGLYMRFNGDTGNNYSLTTLEGNGSATGSTRESSASRTSFGSYTYGIGTSNFAVQIVHIMSYSNTNVYKTVLSSGADAGAFTGRYVGLWRSTSAITSLKVAMSGGFSANLAAGTTVALYGIKAAA